MPQTVNVRTLTSIEIATDGANGGLIQIKYTLPNGEEETEKEIYLKSNLTAKFIENRNTGYQSITFSLRGRPFLTQNFNPNSGLSNSSFTFAGQNMPTDMFELFKQHCYS